MLTLKSTKLDIIKGKLTIGSIMRSKKIMTENAVARSIEWPVPMKTEKITELIRFGKKKTADIRRAITILNFLKLFNSIPLLFSISFSNVVY